jgi:hypothetical protein
MKPILFVFCAAGLAGCGPSASVHLIQQHLRGAERVMRLTTHQAHWGGADGVERVLAEFPLPGARRGEAVYLLYVRLPAGAAEVIVGPAANDATADSPRAKGFFIQTRGDHAGLAAMSQGRIEVAGSGQGRQSARTLKLELTLEDGTRIHGQVRAVRDPWHVEQFEKTRRPADVAALTR